MLSFSSQRRAWVSLGRRLLSTAGPVTEATAAATPDIPNFYTHAATRLPPPFWVLKKAAPTCSLASDFTLIVLSWEPLQWAGWPGVPGWDPGVV